MKKILSLVLSFILLLSFSGCGDDTKEKEDGLKSTIIVKTQTAVESQLKAPATASFPASFDSYQIKEVATGDDTIKQYSVSSYVDAENEFGAKLRNRFVVSLQFKSDMSGYKVLDVKLMDE